MCENLEKTPSFSTPLTYTTSPSTGESSQDCKISNSSKKTSKMKKLRNEIEVLNMINAELTEELETITETVSRLESSVQKKDREINRLNSELLNAQIKEPTCEQETNTVDIKNNEKLEHLIDVLEQEKDLFKEALETAEEEKEATYKELQKMKNLVQKLELREKENVEDREKLENQITCLRNTIEHLTENNKEQSDYIAELTRAKEDSTNFSDSINDNLILPESLGSHVIDLQIRELKDIIEKQECEIKDHTELIKNLKYQLKETEENYTLSCSNFSAKEKTYLREIESKVIAIKNNDDDLRNLECQNMFLSNTVQEKDSIIVSMQSSLDFLNEEIITLRNKQNSLALELQNKCSYNQQLLREIDSLAKVINENTAEKESLVKSIQEKDDALQQCFEELNQVRMEFDNQIRTLQTQANSKAEECRLIDNERMQYGSNIDFYKDEVSTLLTKHREKEKEVFEKLNLIQKLEFDIEYFKSVEIRSKEIIDNLRLELNDTNEELLAKSSLLSKAEDELSSLSSENRNLQVEKQELKDVISQNNELLSSLTEQIKDKEEQKSKDLLEFNSIIEDLKLSVRELSKVKSELDSENKCLREDLSENTNILNSYDIALKSLKAEQKEHLENIMVMTEESSRKENIISELEGNIERLEKEATQLKENQTKLSLEFSNYQKKFQDETTPVDDLKKRLDASKLEEVRLVQSLNGKEEELNDLERKLRIALETQALHHDRAEVLEHEIVDYKKVITEFENKQIFFENILTEKDKLIDSLKSSVNDLNKRISSLESRLDSVNSELDNKKSGNKKLLSEIEDKNKEIHVHLAKFREVENNNLMQITSLNNEMEICKSLKEAADHEVEILQKELKEVLAEREAVLSKLSSVEADHSSCAEKARYADQSMNSLIRELKDKESILKDELVRYSERESNLKTELVNKSYAIRNLEEEVSLKEQCIDTLENSLKKNLQRKETEVSQLEIECKRMLSLIDEKNKELQEFAYKMKAVENDYMIVKTDLENYKSLINDLQKEKESFKTELKEVTSKMQSLEVKHSSCCSTLRNTESILREMRDKESILKEELLHCKERETSLKDEANKKNSVISNIKEELISLQKTLSDREFEEGIMYTKLQAKEAVVNQLKLEVGELKKQLNENEEKFQDDLRIHVKKIHDLDNTIGKLNNQFIKVSREKETLILDLDEKNKLLQEFKTLKSEYERVTRERENLEKELIISSRNSSGLKEQLASSQEELTTVKKNIEKLLAELESKDSELKVLSEVVDQVNAVTTEMNKEKSDLLHQISTQNEVISKLKETVASNETAIEEFAYLKSTIASKDDLLKKLSEENELLMLDIDSFSKKESMLNAQLEAKSNEVEAIRSKFSEAEADSSKLKLACSEHEQTLRSLYATLHSQNAEIREKGNEIQLLQANIKTLNQQLIDLKKDTLNKQKTNQEDSLAASNDERLLTEKDLATRLDEVKESYEKKVEVYKAALKKRFAEKLEDLTFTLQNENTDLKEKFLKEQERCAKLQSELWNASDKLLIAQEENRTLFAKAQGRNVFEVQRPSEPLSPISKARSMEVLSGRNRGIDNFARDISLNESGASVSSRRSSIRSFPRGMGKVFPAAEEDGEVFDNRFLADLKAGVCNVPYDQDRMSTLQFRNSLCPPHLKSSYPAETQFCDALKEDDIKAGSRLTSSSSESDVRKIKYHSSYKKPGPPTPSKNGGRPSLQGNENLCPATPRSLKEGVVNECFVLRESNHCKPEMSAPRSVNASTPRRLKALFTINSKKYENSPKRKSMFLRR